MNDNSLYAEIETDIRESHGVDYFGVAALQEARDYIRQEAGDFYLDYPNAICLGIRICDDVVEQIYNQHVRDAVFVYCHHIYNILSPRLDQAAVWVARQLERKGFRAFPLPCSGNSWAKNNAENHFTDRAKFGPIGVSHKLVANLAGVGWIGKNSLLITPDSGARVRLVTVLTDAPLPSGRRLADGCGDCRQCVDACPVKAITGKPFNPSDDLSERLDPIACNRYRNAVVFPQMQVLGCALCLYACPVGRKPGQRAQPLRPL